MNRTTEILLENREKFTEKRFNKGDTVRFSQRALGVVLEGKLRARNIIGGKKVPLSEFGVNDIFGIATLFSDEETTSEIIAREDSLVLMAEEEKITELISENAEFALSYAMLLTSKIRFLNKKISGYTSKTANDKLLLYLANNDGIIRDLNMTKLAKTLGIGRASLYRSIDELSEERKIEKRGKDIIKL